MIAVVTGNPSFSGLTALAPLQAGVSEAALKISALLRNTAIEMLRSATGQARIADPLSSLDRVFLDCSEDNWDGEGATAIPYRAFEDAERLLYMLPSFIPAPDVLPELIGAVAFEWYRNPRWTYVLSVKGNHSIEFAGLFGPGDEIHGKANFDGFLPGMIAEHLRIFFHQ